MKNKLSVFEQRLNNNIRNCRLGDILPGKLTRGYLESMTDVSGIEFLLADRDGCVLYATGSLFEVDAVDVKANPGEVLTVQDKRMGYLYIRNCETTEPISGMSAKEAILVDFTASIKELDNAKRQFVHTVAGVLEKLASQTYFQYEAMQYIEQNENTAMRMYNLEKEDGLTGVFNKTYFENRLKVIERAQVVPVAVLVVNINDWKFANDHFGDNESDRLIQIVGDILRSEAKEEYVIGRVDGDVFHVLIPMTEDDEAEAYARVVQEKCNTYEDAKLAPSIAIGIQYKTNIEEKLADKLSDAEYEMFENKFEMKNAAGYAERLKHGL